MTLTETKARWAAAVDAYVSDMRENHGANEATTREAYDRAEALMQAAIKTVALCADYGGDAETASVWVAMPESKLEKDLLAWSVEVAKMEAGQ